MEERDIEDEDGRNEDMMAKADQASAAAANTPLSDNEAKVLAFAERTIDRLGIRPTFNGRKYLVYAVFSCIQDPSMLDLLTKELYPKVGRRYMTSAQCVERSIRHAIAEAWTSFGDDKSRWSETFEPFGAFRDDVKPTAGEVIAMLTILYRNPQA